MWIRHVPYEEATGRLRQLYDRVAGPGGNVDNIMLAHSLRPHSMEGHMALYKNVLHHNGNALPRWFLEAIGVLVSHLNGCSYCLEHHYTGMARLLGDDARGAALRLAIEARDFTTLFTPAESSALDYAMALTTSPGDGGAIRTTVDAMRANGLDDERILEINQVAAYFAYANRVVNGLGVTTAGDVLGLSPGNTSDSEDWSHR